MLTHDEKIKLWQERLRQCTHLIPELCKLCAEYSRGWCTIGDKVLCLDANSHRFVGVVIGRQDKNLLVHFCGWGSTFHEYITEDSISFPCSKESNLEITHGVHSIPSELENCWQCERESHFSRLIEATTVSAHEIWIEFIRLRVDYFDKISQKWLIALFDPTSRTILVIDDRKTPVTQPSGELTLLPLHTHTECFDRWVVPSITCKCICL